MYQRAQSHFNTQEIKGKKMLNDLYNVDFVLTGSELIALLLEAEEIKKHKPKYNRMRKSDIFSHCIDWFKDKAGIINFKPTFQSASSNKHSMRKIEKIEEILSHHLRLRSFRFFLISNFLSFFYQKCV